VAQQHAVEYEERIRALLGAIRSGDRPAFDSLVEAVGHEMRKLSAFHLRQRRPGQTLQTTALVHEAVLRMMQMLTKNRHKFPATKEHFMALVSQMMRYTLTDYARKRKMRLVSLDEPRSGENDSAPDKELHAAMERWSNTELDDLLAVDDALATLERADTDYGQRRSAAVGLYVFAGMNYREIADELGITDDTARRDCQVALSRLREILAGPRSQSSSLPT
jgi:RNA polymerase sigma factor (TIGR02999 family)